MTIKAQVDLRQQRAANPHLAVRLLASPERFPVDLHRLKRLVALLDEERKQYLLLRYFFQIRPFR